MMSPRASMRPQLCTTSMSTRHFWRCSNHRRRPTQQLLPTWPQSSLEIQTRSFVSFQKIHLSSKVKTLLRWDVFHSILSISEIFKKRIMERSTSSKLLFSTMWMMMSTMEILAKMMKKCQWLELNSLLLKVTPPSKRSQNQSKLPPRSPSLARYLPLSMQELLLQEAETLFPLASTRESTWMVPPLQLQGLPKERPSSQNLEPKR